MRTNPRLFGALVMIVALVLMTPLPAAAQSDGGATLRRTPDGQPDISGIFTFRTLTPLQRPKGSRDRRT